MYKCAAKSQSMELENESKVIYISSSECLAGVKSGHILLNKDHILLLPMGNLAKLYCTLYMSHVEALFSGQIKANV